MNGGVAVTRHAVLVVLPVQVRTVDVDGKLDGPAVTVEFPCQIVLNDATPSFRELLLNHLTPPDDRDHARVIARLKQRETLAVLESAIKVASLDYGVKAVEDTKELSEDTAGGIAVSETAIPPACSVCSLRARRVWRRRGTQ